MMAHTPGSGTRPGLAPVALDTFRWPGGIDQALAVLRAEPAELTARYGVVFTRDFDDLDWHQVAVVRLPSGRLVMFMRYDGSPGPGTVVAVDRADSLSAAWDELSAVLGVDDAATSWQSEFMHGAGADGRTAA